MSNTMTPEERNTAMQRIKAVSITQPKAEEKINPRHIGMTAEEKRQDIVQGGTNHMHEINLFYQS